MVSIAPLQPARLRSVAPKAPVLAVREPAPALRPARRVAASPTLSEIPVSVPKAADGHVITTTDLAGAIREAKAHRMGWNPIKNVMNLLWFAQQSHRGARWDFKNLPTNKLDPNGGWVRPGETAEAAAPGQDYGNFAYGVLGPTMRIPRWVLSVAAGLVSIHDRETKFNWEFLKAAFDIPRDKAIIEKGFNYFDQNRAVIATL